MMRTMTAVKEYLAATLFIVIGLMAYGCGDSATVNPEVELSSLTVSPGTLQPSFNGGTTQYSVDLSNNVTSVTVTAQAAVSGDTVTINGQTTTRRVISLGAAGSTTSVNIVVSESSTSSRTYTVLLRRASLAGNNSLQGLAISPGTLAPAFNANELLYTVDVGNNVGSFRVTPTLQDPDATMTVNGQATDSGQARTITLNPAGQSTSIRMVVEAQNGTQKTYLVSVSRGVSGNNNLRSLTITPGTLDPRFSAGEVGYTVNVGNNVTSVTVTAASQDATARLTINGQQTASRSITLGPAGSSTPVIIVVTAQNGTQKTYTAGVLRAAPGGNNNLQSLTISPGPLVPNFAADTENYTVDVASTVDSVTVTPRLQTTTATMTVEGQATTSGQSRTITLRAAGLSTVIDIVVTAQNGSRKPYTVTVDRAALGGNNNLSTLSVSPGTLSPSPFTAARTAYTVNNVSSSATAITVNADPQDAGATVTINDVGGNSRSIPLPTGPSTTEIEVRVIPPNRISKTYFITVNQPAPAAPTKPATPDLIPEDDSGFLPGQDSDNITNVTTPRFRISQPGAGETPSLYVGIDPNPGAKVPATFDPVANTLRPTSALSDGVYTITSTVANGGGESPQSDPLTVTIDTAPPPPPPGNEGN
jgi:hypothetical protein